MNTIKTLLWNTRGVRNKKKEIKQKFNEPEIDIGIVTETKMKSNVNNKNNNICFTGYNKVSENPYNKETGGAGGVTILVKKDIVLQKIPIEKVGIQKIECVAVYKGIR